MLGKRYEDGRRPADLKGPGESGLDDTNDGERNAIDVDRLSKDGRVGAASALPERVGQHHRRRRLAPVICRIQQATPVRLQAQVAEERTADQLPALEHGLAIEIEVQATQLGERKQTGDGTTLFGKVPESRVRERGAGDLAVIGLSNPTVDSETWPFVRRPVQENQLIGFFDRQLVKNHPTRHCEDRGVGSDAKCQRQDDDDRKNRSTDRYSGAETQVHPELSERGEPFRRSLSALADPDALLTYVSRIAEASRRLAPSRLRRHAALLELFSSHFEMEIEFVVDIDLDIRAPQSQVAAPRRRATHDWAHTGRSVALRILARASAKLTQLDSPAWSCCRPRSVKP